MKRNMSNMDRVIRLIVVAVVAGLIFTNTVSGILAIILGVLAVVFVGTSLVNVCPLYAIFGISTCKVSPEKQ
ncbi:MAG: DUF2892 domain-containing protein [Bacteroidota bacterium]